MELGALKTSMMERLSQKVKVEQMPSIRVRPSLTVEMKQRFLQQDYVDEPIKSTQIHKRKNSSFGKALRLEEN